MYLGGEDITNINFETIDFFFDCAKEFQNRRFAEAVSDNDLQQLIESQSIRNTRRKYEMVC